MASKPEVDQEAVEELKDIAVALGMALVETIRIGTVMGLATMNGDKRKLDTANLHKLWRDLVDKIGVFVEKNP